MWTVDFFRDRLKLAAKHAGVEYGQTAIAISLDLKRKQTVDRWMGDGMPSVKMLYRIADKWDVDPRWLGTGRGDSRLDSKKWTPASDNAATDAKEAAPPRKRFLSGTSGKKAAAPDAKTKGRTA